MRRRRRAGLECVMNSVGFVRGKWFGAEVVRRSLDLDHKRGLCGCGEGSFYVPVQMFVNRGRNPGVVVFPSFDSNNSSGYASWTT